MHRFKFVLSIMTTLFALACSGGGDDSSNNTNNDCGGGCPVGQICFEGACYDEACTTDAECVGDQICSYGRCEAPECGGEVFCRNLEMCDEGRCVRAVFPCSASQQCGGATCDTLGDCSCLADGVCGESCDEDSDCIGSEVCESSQCKVLNLCEDIMCPLGEVCVEGDCLAPCGDDLCETNETCSNETCFPTCSDTSDCEDGRECFGAESDGVCKLNACDGIDCPVGQLCYEGACYEDCNENLACSIEDEACYQSGSCRDDSDPCDRVHCPVGDVCYEGACYDPCDTDGDCTPPNICYDGRCAEGECDGVDCLLGEQCVDGSCVEPCEADSDCSVGVCTDGACTPHPCDGMTCPTVPEETPTSGMLTMNEPRTDLTFDAVEGELIALRVTTSDLDGALILYDPDFANVGTAAFDSASTGWLPIRIPRDGTYTVSITASNTGSFEFDYTRYGLDTPTDSPFFEQTIQSAQSFYFFATPQELIAADLVQPGTSQSGTFAIELLQPDLQWTAADTVPGHEVSASHQGQDIALLGEAVETGIYRVRAARSSGNGDLTVRIGKISKLMINNTILVDSTGTCAGHQTGIPRLAAAAIPEQASVEFCDGSHPEYGTIVLDKARSSMVASAGANPHVVYSGTRGQGEQTLVRFENASDVTIDGVGFETSVDVDSTLFELADGTNGATFQNVEVALQGTAGFPRARVFLVSAVTPPGDISITDSTFTGPVSMGTLTGPNTVFSRNQVSPMVGLFDMIIDGDGVAFEENILGRAGPTPAPNAISWSSLLFIGSNVNFARNQIWLDGLINFNAGNGFNRTNRESNVTLIDNQIIHSTEASVSSVSVVNLQDLDQVTMDANYVEVNVPTSVALELDEVSGTITNNRVIGLEGNVVEVNNGESLATDPLLIVNNTIRFAGTDSGTALEVNSGGSRTQVFNTIFVNQAATPDSGHCAIDGPALQVRDYNLFENWTNPLCAGGGVPGANNVVGSANLASDLTLQSGSLAIDAGRATGAPATDFEGDARPQGSAVDIGADEF